MTADPVAGTPVEPLVDTHVHVASPDRRRYPLAVPGDPDAWYQQPGRDVEALLAEMDRAGVAAAVLVQAHGPYRYDNRYCADARAVAPHRLGAVSTVDVTAPDAVTRLTHWATRRAMGGTRLVHLPPLASPWLDDRRTEPVWQGAAALGLRVSVCTVRRYLGALGRLLAWAPAVPVCLDHCGLVERGGAPVDASALDEVLALARHPQLHLKVSPHVLDLGEALGWRPGDLVATLVGAFGPERVLWGSDWPNAGRPYGEAFSRGIEAAEALDDRARAEFLGGAALRLWPELVATTPTGHAGPPAGTGPGP